MTDPTIADKLEAIEQWLSENRNVIDKNDCEYAFCYTKPTEREDSEGVDASFSFCMSKSSRIHLVGSLLRELYNEFQFGEYDDEDDFVRADKSISYEMFALECLHVHDEYSGEDEYRYMEEDDDESYD